MKLLKSFVESSVHYSPSRGSETLLYLSLSFFLHFKQNIVKQLTIYIQHRLSPRGRYLFQFHYVGQTKVLFFHKILFHVEHVKLKFKLSEIKGRRLSWLHV